MICESLLYKRNENDGVSLGYPITRHVSRNGASACALLIAAAVLAVLALAGFQMLAPAQLAYADGELISLRIVAPASEIEELTQEYKEAYEAVDETGWKATLARVEKKHLNAQLAEQRQRADEAVSRLFKLQNSGYRLVDMLLTSDSLNDFIKMSEYLDAVTRRTTEELNEAVDECAQIEAKKGALEEREKKDLERLAEAEQALREAQDSRAARQSEGIFEGLAQDPTAEWINDGANWYTTEGEFVAEWAPRIDAYLEGSPMAGLGKAFAEASWRYCVDPRWSPAIAHIESSKGLLCVRPYNAWGWGAADEDPVGLALEWSSWETAIDAHVRGLSAGYGYTISLANAQKYCTSWENWYAVTLSQMASI